MALLWQFHNQCSSCNRGIVGRCANTTRKGRVHSPVLSRQRRDTIVSLRSRSYSRKPRQSSVPYRRRLTMELSLSPHWGSLCSPKSQRVDGTNPSSLPLALAKERRDLRAPRPSGLRAVDPPRPATAYRRDYSAKLTQNRLRRNCWLSRWSSRLARRLRKPQMLFRRV